MSIADEKIQKLKFSGAVDADGHILEDAGLWDRYIEAKYKDRALRTRLDSKGQEYLEVAGKPSKIFHSGRLGGLSAMGTTRDDQWQDRPTYGGMAPFGAMDAKERLQRIDAEGLAAAFLYPTMSLLWETETDDPELAAGRIEAALERIARRMEHPIATELQVELAMRVDRLIERLRATLARPEE